MQYDTRTRQALLRRGREFMRARQEYVRDADCLPSMIMACIEGGIATRNDIVRTVPKFVGHNYATVAWALDEHAGPCPDRDLWFRDENKTYHVHPAPVDLTGMQETPAT